MILGWPVGPKSERKAEGGVTVAAAADAAPRGGGRGGGPVCQAARTRARRGCRLFPSAAHWAAFSGETHGQDVSVCICSGHHGGTNPRRAGPGGRGPGGPVPQVQAKGHPPVGSTRSRRPSPDPTRPTASGGKTAVRDLLPSTLISSNTSSQNHPERCLAEYWAPRGPVTLAHVTITPSDSDFEHPTPSAVGE